MTYKRNALEFERSRNRRYLSELQQKSVRTLRGVTQSVSRTASSNWTGTARPLPPSIPRAPLIGRVKLSQPDELLGSDFYIGPWFIDGPDTAVISWAAPAADAFFANSDNPHPLRDHVLVRRVLISGKANEVTDLFDDAMDTSGASSEVDVDPFAGGPLVIPNPPSGAGFEMVPQLSASDEGASPTVPHGNADQVVEGPDPLTAQPANSADVRPQIKRSKGRSSPVNLRSQTAVEAVVRKPREGQLSHVLATIQPDQIRLVKASAEVSLIVEGNPGTGKTIIASHRAAFLVNDDRGARTRHRTETTFGPRLRRDSVVSAKTAGQAKKPTATRGRVRTVLLVGPNSAYAEHVGGVIDSLTVPGRVTVKGIEALMSEIAEVPLTPGEIDGSVGDLDPAVLRLVKTAYDGLRKSERWIERAPHGQVRARVYEVLRANRVGERQISRDADDLAWMATLPNLKSALQRRSHLPLLAAIGQVAWSGSSRFDHVIVDEAQDIRPLEWALLSLINGGDWTLIGDLNQRRSHHSSMSWNTAKAVIAEFSDHTATWDETELRTGYRSTRQIIGFAQRLLPSRERSAQCVQTDGIEPKVRKSSADFLIKAAIEEAVCLREKYPSGTTAIITTTPGRTRSQFAKWRKMEGGARKGASSEGGPSNGQGRLLLLTPENARGLEFDAVVVVEPASYPQSLVGNGLLYTSLTRANRELVVVHSEPLPDKLRKR